MAAPITHVVLAVKIFNTFFQGKVKKDFFIGTLFPDIRYLKVIDRDKTHYNNLTLDDLKEDDSFLAGVKFHSILDVAREKFMVDHDVYSLCPESKYVFQSLKLLEDQLFYSYIENWNEYIDYLHKILPSALDFGVAKNDIEKWQSLLQQYFQAPPSEQVVINFALAVGFTNDIAYEINKNIITMSTNKKIVNIIKKLYKNFDSLI